MKINVVTNFSSHAIQTQTAAATQNTNTIINPLNQTCRNTIISQNPWGPIDLKRVCARQKVPQNRYVGVPGMYLGYEGKVAFRSSIKNRKKTPCDGGSVSDNNGHIINYVGCTLLVFY